MSKLSYWDSSIKLELMDRRKITANEAHEILAAWGVVCPHIISFPRPAWNNDEFYHVLSARDIREIKFQPAIMKWLEENCTGRFLDWPDLNQVCFQNKSDAIRFKLTWG